MHRIAHAISVIQHFIYSDHKAEVFVGTAAATGTGIISSQNEALVHELMLRNINTAVMAVVAAAIGFFVTMGLKKIFEKK